MGELGSIIRVHLRTQEYHQAPSLFLAHNAPESKEETLLVIMSDIVRIGDRRRRFANKIVDGNIIEIG